MTDLGTAELYHVRLDPTRLNPNTTLVRIPDNLIAIDQWNGDGVIQDLKRGISSTGKACTQKQSHPWFDTRRRYKYPFGSYHG